MKCEICNKECNGTKGLAIHLTKIHNLSDVQLKEYYDNHLKTNSNKCYFCDNEAKFMGFTKGYHKICDSKECLGKTRATGTHEFLMYKYDLSEKDAKILQQKRADARGKKIKTALDTKLSENENFHKEKSHQTKEFWIKKGFTEENAIKKAKEVMDMIHEKTWIKRRNHPELYQDVNTTQLEYWLKKGYNLENAMINLSKRQRFDKHYSSIELDLIKNIVEKLGITDYYSTKNFVLILYLNKKIYSYDFAYKNKIIEFNGDYWHCNPNLYKPDFFNISKQMTAEEIWNYDLEKMLSTKEAGYDYLVIWESEYKENKEKVIEKCIEFLKN